MLQGMSHRILVPALVVAAFLAFAGSGQATPPSPELSVAVRIHVAVVPPVPGSRRQLRAMMQEAEAVWRPYDVQLVWLSPERSGSTPRPDALLLVKFVCPAPSMQPTRTSGRPSLGTIQFFDGDIPDDTICLLADEIAARVVSANVYGPQAVVDEVIGRATGRVLAHELGHYLLASRAHTRNGLMRRSFGSQEMADLDRKAFRLDETTLPRLRARLAALTAVPTNAPRG